jgi:carbamate kinase
LRIVIALGGNALLRRGEALTADNQLDNIKHAAMQIVKLAQGNQLIITHGNGPQVGLLALQNAAYVTVKPYPLDILSAETEGMIGYLLEQEIANLLPPSCVVTTLLTRVEVDPHDSAFTHPHKPIGPMYTKNEADRIFAERGWSMAADGEGFRRVVPSPQPKKILGIDPILWLLDHNAVVIAAGGGGIPVVFSENGRRYTGIEAIIDKDLCSSKLAVEIAADYLLIGTDVDAVYLDWGRAAQHPIRNISAIELKNMNFPEGSMAPKVKAACAFVEATKNPAIIGTLNQLEGMLQGSAGTRITP